MSNTESAPVLELKCYCTKDYKEELQHQATVVALTLRMLSSVFCCLQNSSDHRFDSSSAVGPLQDCL